MDKAHTPQSGLRLGDDHAPAAGRAVSAVDWV